MLQSKQYPRCKAKVLVAFELVPAELVENDTYPFFDDIRPSTKEATVSIFLVGVRLFSPVQRPYVEVCDQGPGCELGQRGWRICHSVSLNMTKSKVPLLSARDNFIGCRIF